MRCADPKCSADLEALTAYGDHACPACGLAGPRDVLEQLAARLAPAGVMAEAERLFDVANVAVADRLTTVRWRLMRKGHGFGWHFGDTLAEAYALAAVAAADADARGRR